MPRTTRHHGWAARCIVTACAAAVVSAAPLQPVFGQKAPLLGAAGSFAALAGSTLTCADSLIAGRLGAVAPGHSVTQSNCTVAGETHEGDLRAGAAREGFLGAYEALALARCTGVLNGSVSGVTLAPGVYCFDASANLTGDLTLDGPEDGVWVFKIGTSGSGDLTGSDFSVVAAMGGSACNIYWWVAGAAMLTASYLQGTILTGAGTTFTGGRLRGRALASAAVALTGVTVMTCAPEARPFDCHDEFIGAGRLVPPSDSKPRRPDRSNCLIAGLPPSID
jgi:hypothetical protein